ncbi:MAG: hypothetical protein QGH98_04835 [Nitrospinaceae bacterium]|jgi:hypothetical protein|nr:hypothetical protein [Nitrospinaceae bacterium]|tara:strand:- start:1724 stop:2680 length:957 start_codon:yes stop_codon:yes gene_type:complete
MEQTTTLPEQLYYGGKVNMYCLHEVFRHIAVIACERMQTQYHIDIPITSGLWGGAYLVGDQQGKVLSRVIRFYSIVNLPQNSPLNEPENFGYLMNVYYQTCQEIFKRYHLVFENPQWGEPVPYTNKIRPNTTLQMWEKSTEVQFLRTFFVWNTATWEESLIFDTLRNIKQLKELLDINHRPVHKTKEEIRFALQDILIIYHTLRNALTPEFLEHVQSFMKELLGYFLEGLHDSDLIQNMYQKAYGGLFVYGFEEALDGPYKQHNLDICKVEDWPAEKINWVPEELKEKLVHPLRETFSRFRINLERGGSNQHCPFLSL